MNGWSWRACRRRNNIKVWGLIGSSLLTSAAFAALPPVPTPPANPVTEDKRILGKILFWDEQLSTSNAVSCGTCHNMGNGGADPRLARNPGLDGLINTPDDILGSPGIIRSDIDNDYENSSVFALNPQITGRAANVTINAAFAPLLFWDGRASGQFTDPETGQVALQANAALESQAVGPPLSDIEMAHSGQDWGAITRKLARVRPLALATQIPADIAPALANDRTYTQLFTAAFGDGQISARRIAMAIATYERTLISNQAPFDAFRAGNINAMTPQQVQGFNEFQAHNCTGCHSVVNDLFTDFSFRNVGLRPVAEDSGRQAITGLNADRGRFKVPSLRNVGLKRSFMHNGQFATLTDVIRFYARAGGAPAQFPDNRDPLMNAVVPLPPQDAGLIQDFLQNGLTDPRVANRTFPFDQPTLFTQRPADQATIVGGGTPGTGGVTPIIIAQAPPMLGNLEYRLGLSNARPNSTARLVLSSNPPVGGVITPTRSFDPLLTGSTPGVATQHWPLSFGQATAGQVLFAQWVVDDPGAAGGVARSNVARITFFCGSSGCPSPCDAIDLDFDRAIDISDLIAFLSAFEHGDLLADVDDDGDAALGVPNKGVDINDLIFFLARFEQGC